MASGTKVIQRRVLPATLAWAVAVAGVVYSGEHAHYFGPLAEAVALGVAMCVSLAVILVWSARSIERADRERRHREQELQAILSAAPAAIYVKDMQGRYTISNAEAARMAGLDPGDLVGLTDEDVRPGRAIAGIAESDRRVLAGEQHQSEVVIPGADGNRTWLFTKFPLRDDDETVFAICGIATDITERQVQETRALLESLVASTSDAIVACSLDGTILSWNAGAERLSGLTADEVLGTKVPLLDPDAPDTAGLLDRIRAGESITNVELRRPGKHGEVDVELSLSPLRDHEGEVTGLSVIARDISARKALEEQLRHSQKLDALGQLAGGIAHDFNNLLTVITGYGSMLQDQVAGEKQQRLLGEILKAAGSAQGLTRRLLAFSRREPQEVRPFDLADVVAGIDGILRRLLGARIEITLDARAEPATILADPNQVEQVLINLAVNARDAMPNGGRLEIATSNERVTGRCTRDYVLTPPDGDHVVITVRDSGSGIDEQVRAKIFDPFFTTKAPGEGTGLGLAMLYSVVEAAGGGLALETAPGEGTCFTLLFPAAQAA